MAADSQGDCETLVKMVDVIKKFRFKKWNWRVVSRNSNISKDDIVNNSTWSWNREFIMLNPNITMNDIFNNGNTKLKRFIDKKYIIEICQNPNITMETVKKYPGFGWQWDLIIKNPGIYPKDVFENIDIPWNLDYLSGNPNLTPNDIESHPEIKWNDYIFNSIHMTKEFVLAHIDEYNSTELKYYMYDLSKNLKLTINDFEDYPRLANLLDWSGLSENISFTISDIIKNPQYPWEWEWVSNNPNVTLQIIIDSMGENTNDNNIDWDWSELIRNPGIDFNDINDNCDLPWDLTAISWNPNLTAKNIIDHPEIEWNFEALSYLGIIT